ncbi:MAG: cytochrome c oxidase subunit 2A [Bacteroidota bacterium]|nr:cytochrome c oxidase subunit 2A [Flavisolibacter sp.]MBD0297019.1 cytochrome c oxidase subunit 2A [Flavisolibacter sp.]MBD0364691.1 cytochrome c oxidase subunit 2A [Flavisolibacter sp.]MDQ3844333.1 cytochrome c oxidase subunit 2A [Bacteroidota bacterium]
MNITETESPTAKVTPADQDFDRNFKPRGAIAFFILLVILGLIIWYGIYFLMLKRA